MKGMFKEFKEFAMRGSVIDLAVGVVIGAAFGKIVDSLVKDIIMPPIGLLLGGVDFSDKVIMLKAATAINPAVTINYGLFLNNIVSFLVIAFAIFIFIKQMNRFRKKEEAKPSESSLEVKLLTEIRDEIRSSKS